ncbi:MAG: hypothetical protein IJ859_04190 [Synergistaceae bacterium]|nr:hypothetical protein [Synergistaceae bacterium]
MEYVSKELFDEREAKNRAIMEKNQADIHSEIKSLNIALNAKMDVLNARMDVLDMKIDKVEEKLSTAIEGLIDRFDDMKEHQNKWFTLFGILFTAAAVVTPIAVAVIQHYLK